MTSPFTRARSLGMLLLGLAFAAGLATGLAIGRRQPEGVQIMVTATDRIPKDLERLGLSAPQRQSIQAALGRGRPRIFRVLQDFDPRIQAAIDSTESEIAAVLNPGQRAAWEASRRERLRRDTMIIRDDPGR